MRLSQWPQCLQSKTRYPQCKPAKAGRQPAQNGAKSPHSLAIGAAFGAWLVPGDRRPVGLAVELAASTQGMAAALARHLVGCALADWCLPLPWASWGVPQPRWAQRRCRGAQPAGAVFAAQPCEVGKGGRVKSLTHPSRKPNVSLIFACGKSGEGGHFQHSVPGKTRLRAHHVQPGRWPNLKI